MTERVRDQFIPVARPALLDLLPRRRRAVARSERAAKAVGALSHPNIPAPSGGGAHPGVSHAVTELLGGDTRRAGLAQSPIPWPKATETGTAVADGLAAA